MTTALQQNEKLPLVLLTCLGGIVIAFCVGVLFENKRQQKEMVSHISRTMQCVYVNREQITNAISAQDVVDIIDQSTYRNEC